MIGPIDKWIEKLIARTVRKKRNKILRETIDAYIEKHHPDDETLAELKEALEVEMDRIFAFLERSLIHASVLRARYTFWITAIISTAIIIALASFPITTSIAPFFVPLMAAFVSWAVALATIPVSYIHAVKGAMSARVLNFELALLEKDDVDRVEALNNQVAALREALIETQAMVDELSNKLVSEPGPRTLKREATLKALSSPSLLWASTRRAALSKSQEKEIEIQFRLTSIHLQ